MKGKILQKFIAMILVFCLTSANFILVGTNAVYALSNRNTEIENGNIVFDAYFKDGDKKVYSKTAQITSGEKLYLNLELKAGVLENAKVKIDNANFKIIKEDVKNQYVSFVNEDTNEIQLNKITYGNNIEIELPVRFEKSENIGTDYFSMENNIILSGRYKDTSEKDINGTITTSLTWTNEVKTNYETSVEKYINEEDKTLIEQKIISKVEGNVLPKTKETIKINVPKIKASVITTATEGEDYAASAITIKDILPSKMYVLVNGTKLSDEIITNGYNLTEGTLEFSKDFIKDNKISWGNGTDEYTIVYIYEQEMIEKNNEINVLPEIKTEIYGHEQQLSGNPKASFTSGDQNKGTVVSAQGSSDKSDIYKGYMYSNSEETNYNETYKVEISDKEDINKIDINFVEDNFKTEDGTLKSTNESTLYKEIKINKENMKNILGADGSITIVDLEGTEYKIDNSAIVDEQGNIVKEVNTHGITITTSKPEQEGVLEINAKKAIIGNAKYSREELKTINAIETKMNIKTDASEEISEMLLEKELKETKTEATLEINNENRGNILTAIEENNVEFIATLRTGTMDADLYREPTLKVILPQEVNELKINSVSALYAGSQMEVEGFSIGTTSEGNKTIEVKLKGEQIKYDNKLSDGIKITINAGITLDELALSKDSRIDMKYTNQNGSEKEYSTGIDVKIQSREGVILRNTLTIGETTKKTFNEEVLSQSLEVDGKEKTANVNMSIVNNYDKTIENVSIVGKLPAEGIQEKAFETTLKSTFKANIKNGINLDGDIIEILYSEDENSTADSDSWNQEIENAKAYKIVVKDNKLEVGERIDISYNLVIPQEISYNESTYQKLDLSYTYEGQNITKVAASYLFTEVKTSSQVEETAEGIIENINGLDVKVVAISGGKELKDGDEIYEGQTIKYVLTLTNNTGNDLTNLKIESNHENANVFDEDTYEESDSFNTDEMKKFTYILEQEGKSNKNIQINDLKNEETTTVTYQVRTRENVQNIKGSIKISTEGLPERSIKINNNVKEGKLKLTIYNHVTVDDAIRKDETLANRLTIKNISGQKLENVRVSFNIPEEMSLKHIEESDEYSIIENKDNYIELELKQLEASESKDISVELVSTEEVKYKLLNLQFYAKTGDEVYFSNEIETLLKNDEKSNLEISQTGDVDGEELKNGDKLTYITTIKNNGEGRAQTLTIIDNVPEVANITNAYIERGDKKENIEDIEDNTIIDILSDVEPEEEIKFYVETQIDSSKASGSNVTNKVEVHSDDEEIQSNEVTYRLMDYIGENPGDGQITDDGEEIVDGDNSELNGDDNDNENGNSTVITTNSISGLVWLDENKNGIRDDSEKTLEGIKVTLANIETGKYLADENGNIIEKTTNENGKYIFENVETGKYIVVFKYDNTKYRNTEYRATGATDSTNSDIITSKVSINDDSTKYAVTDTLELNEESLEDIDAGFIENEIFDLSLNKYVSKVTIQNKSGTTVKQYNKEQLAKIEIDAKQIAGSTVLIEYEIQVSNEGELPGYANEIVDYIPSDLKFSSEINKDWYTTTDGNLHSTALSKNIINPGETKTLTLTLVKTMTENNAGITSNKAEIAKSSNNLSIPDIDSTPGNNAQGEDDISTAEVIISIRTGLALTIGVITTIIALTVGGVVIYTIKRKEAKHE